MRITNRKARFNYHILETLEAGVVLTGAEVKSVRAGRVDLSESFAKIQNGEAYLKNAYINPYMGAQLDPKRDRKLLLHKKQLNYLMGKTSGQSTALVPLSIYNKHNFIKVELALGASKKKYDKRMAIKKKDEQRKLEQELF